MSTTDSAVVKDDLDLIATEESLHQLAALRKSIGEPVDVVVEAHRVIAAEMRKRGLLYTPMTKDGGKVDRDPDHDGDDDSSNNDDDTDDDGGLARPAASKPSEAHGGTEQQNQNLPRSQPKEGGPNVRKTSAVSNSGPPAAGSHPKGDLGYITPKGTKRGKGGAANEKPRNDAHPGDDVDGDTDDENDGTLGYIHAVKKGEAAPHPFWPVRDVCSDCKKPTAAHGDGGDHDFKPVRNICRTCRAPHTDHLSKALDATPQPMAKAIGDLGFMEFFKELPQLSTEQRQSMAEQGIALPDGSFPIPDEAHLHAAIRLVGQAPDPQSAMNHIIERAHAMGMQEALPPSWNVSNDPNQGIAQVGVGAHSMPGSGGEPQPPGASNARPAAGGGETGSAGFEGGGAAAPNPGGLPNGGAGSGAQATEGTAGSAGAPDDPAKKKRPATPVTPGSLPGGPTQQKPGLLKAIASAVSSVMGSSFDADGFVKELSINMDPDFEYAVVKSAPEERYTLGPVYMPGQLDAHGEWATADDLQHATWDFVKAAKETGDHSVFLQHSDRPAGEWVEVMAWPHPVVATMTKAVDGVQKSESTTFPGGTVYMGVVWEPWAYEMVKSGKITGFSMGGWAQRVEGVPS